MFLIDHETSVDLLYYDAIAEILVKRVSECKAKPITVGVHGDSLSATAEDCASLARLWRNICAHSKS